MHIIMIRGVFGQQFDPLVFQNFFKVYVNKSQNDSEGVDLALK